MITEFFQEQSKPSKKALERYQNLSKEKKKKSKNMVLIVIRVFLKKKNAKCMKVLVNNTKIF